MSDHYYGTVHGGIGLSQRHLYDVHVQGQTPTPSSHTFERIQFQKATANNGKRRAQQQFYHLKVELLADVSSPTSSTPSWEIITIRVSEGIIVRGRSPSHYKAESEERADLHDAQDLPSPRIKHESPTPGYMTRDSSTPYRHHRSVPSLDAPGSSMVNPSAYHYHRPLNHDHYTHHATLPPQT